MPVSAILRLLFILVLSGAIALGQVSGPPILNSSPNPANYGQAAKLTATVISGATGKITFDDGPSVLGIGTISGTQATLTTVLLPSGTTMAAMQLTLRAIRRAYHRPWLQGHLLASTMRLDTRLFRVYSPLQLATLS